MIRARTFNDFRFSAYFILSVSIGYNFENIKLQYIENNRCHPAGDMPCILVEMEKVRCRAQKLNIDEKMIKFVFD